MEGRVEKGEVLFKVSVNGLKNDGNNLRNGGDQLTFSMDSADARKNRLVNEDADTEGSRRMHASTLNRSYNEEKS